MAPKEQTFFSSSSSNNNNEKNRNSRYDCFRTNSKMVDVDLEEDDTAQQQTLHSSSSERAPLEDLGETSSTLVELGGAKDWTKYQTYALKVDPLQDDKATELILFTAARPHMRAFHCSWWSFFIAFFLWFSISPLLGEIRDDLALTDEEVWTSSILGVGVTMFARILLGPLCDKYGARILFAIVLCVASIPTACTGLVQTAHQLNVVRVFVGIAGGNFVMNQYWISTMFSREIVGTANGLGAGWGNMGGGVASVVIGSILFPLFKLIFGEDSQLAWRAVFIIPAILAMISGIVVYNIADDSPKGQYWERKKNGQMPQVSATKSLAAAARNPNCWILMIHYACSFGVELTMNNAAALYYKDEFGLSTESAAAVASIFGWMNLFARGAGGIISDYANANYGGMGGRLLVQAYFLALEGVLIVMFASSQTLAGTIIVMIFFSLFVQAAQGSTYGIVPYVNSEFTGAVSGIVGAGANVGAVGFGLGFRQLSYRHALILMGFAAMLSSLLTAFIQIDGHSTLLAGLEADDEGKNEHGTEQKELAGFLHFRPYDKKEHDAGDHKTNQKQQIDKHNNNKKGKQEQGQLQSIAEQPLPLKKSLSTRTTTKEAVGDGLKVPGTSPFICV
ncbi:hypothetical protein ACA910_014124 [Epithemia clementina (nom. ined.)]